MQVFMTLFKAVNWESAVRTVTDTDFFVISKMSGVLVRFVILVGAPIETRRGKYRKHIKAKGFLFLNKSK